MNVTVATELIRNYVGWTHEKFDATLARLPAGSRGLLLLPYFEGERTPNVPVGTGVLFGVNHRTWCAEASPAPPKASPRHELRPAPPGGPRCRTHTNPRDRRGSKSKAWRQIMADVFNAPVVTLKVSEGAAYGAALQACSGAGACRKARRSPFRKSPMPSSNSTRTKPPSPTSRTSASARPSNHCRTTFSLSYATSSSVTATSSSPNLPDRSPRRWDGDPVCVRAAEVCSISLLPLSSASRSSSALILATTFSSGARRARLALPSSNSFGVGRKPRPGHGFEPLGFNRFSGGVRNFRKFRYGCG